MTVKVSVRDIARKLKISPSAVSKALNNRPGVGDELRVKVRKTAEQMGYARHLPPPPEGGQGGEMKFIVVLYAGIGGHLIEQIQQGMDHTIRHRGYQEIRYLIDGKNEIATEERKSLFLKHLLTANGVAGVISCYVKLSDPLIAELYRHKIPVVLLEYHTEFGRCVTIDHVRASCRAVSELIRLGRRHIACIMPAEEVDHIARERLDGYRRALREEGLEYEGSLVVHANWEGVDAGRRATRILLDNRPDVDGILYGSDREAYGGMQALRAVGRRIPEDVAVIGFDDMEFNGVTVPTLSSVRQPIRKMAETGLRMLFDSIEKGDFLRRSVVLDTELVLRSSCPKS